MLVAFFISRIDIVYYSCLSFILNVLESESIFSTIYSNRYEEKKSLTISIECNIPMVSFFGVDITT